MKTYSKTSGHYMYAATNSLVVGPSQLVKSSTSYNRYMCSMPAKGTSSDCYTTLWHWVYLEVAQEMTEVDVEQLPTLGDHDVVRVPVSDAQDIGGHTVAGTGEAERFSRLLQPTGTVPVSLLN